MRNVFNAVYQLQGDEKSVKNTVTADGGCKECSFVSVLQRDAGVG